MKVMPDTNILFSTLLFPESRPAKALLQIIEQDDLSFVRLHTFAIVAGVDIIFIDLDGLKYINDEFGHHEGDMYILNAAKHLRLFSPTVVACRIGAVGPDNKMPASDILSIADEKIYENKRMRKKERKTERENKI